MDLITLDDVYAAAKSIAGVALRTPLLSAPWGDRLWLKPESLQPVGSFKIRGATHAMARLSAEQRSAGVVTHSSGNHGRAVAYAAAAFGAPCVVVMPDAAPPMKIEAVRALGAQVELVPPADRLTRAEELVAGHGLTMIPPFDHRDVIAGQGTVGLEIVEDLPDVEVVLVPVGGGGLASGVATAVRALHPSVRVVGVEPELAADARESLRSGELVVWPVEQTYRTMADGLRTHLSELTLAHLRARLDGIVTVSESQIGEAVGVLAREARLVVEPSGALGVAALRHHTAELPVGRTVAVLTGGNLDPALLAALIVS
ncbi:MAG TPA: threonine/serine dehydratase [Micromonosporaceae bacterium]|nr:threonine/serine dehydratase [Micromonosporaceae bacterium]